MTDQPPRLLLAEDDTDIRQIVTELLAEEGYDIKCAASIQEAFALADRWLFHLVLSDLFHTLDEADPLAAARTFREYVAPTPVLLMTGWRLTTEQVHQAGFAGLLAKPFDIDNLLAQVAANLRAPLTPEQEQQAETVRRYFAALSARDSDGLVALCTEDVVYVLPGTLPLSGVVEGKEAFHRYTEDTFAQFPAAHFDQVAIHALPRGLAARYQGSWQTPEGARAEMPGSVCFRFRGEHIAQIGVHLSEQRLRALARLER